MHTLRIYCWIAAAIIYPALAVAAEITNNASVSDFNGTYEGVLDATLRLQLNCNTREGCSISDGRNTEKYDIVVPLHASAFSQAQFALDYARDRKEAAIAEIPSVAPLLRSTANIVACIDIRQSTPTYNGADEPGLNALCKVAPNPWKEPVIIYMPSIIASCGLGFCRFALLPLFRKQQTGPSSR